MGPTTLLAEPKGTGLGAMEFDVLIEIPRGSRNKYEVDHATGQIEAGTVWVNDWHMVNAAYPFGGYKQSGLGRELGPHALDEYTEEKFVHVDLSGRLDRRAYPLLLGTPSA